MWTKLSAVRLTLPRTHFCLRRHLHAKSENIGHGSVKKNWAYYGAVSTFVGAAFYLQFKQLQAEAKHPSTGNGGKPKRTFTRKEVAEHSSVEKGVWVIFGNGIYDVTNFVPNHPGGSKIMLAAGASIEPFWKVYTIHQTAEVRKILEEHRIGDLDPKDLELSKKLEPSDVNDPFSNDPIRNPALLVRSQKPFNAETPFTILGDQFITPNDFFYVRHHLPVPEIKESDFFLTIEDNQRQIARYSLSELKAKFPKQEVVVTLQCSGNRRKDMQVAGTVQGLSWDKAAIGNALWGGVYLRDVLAASGLDIEKLESDTLHVRFDGADGYGASVPAEKVASKRGDVLLAYEMNGEALPRDHGYPLRVMIPGHTAARSVKWVNKISIAPEESESHWQRNDYKGFNPSTDWNNIKWECAEAIQEMPVQSAILVPNNGDKIDGDTDEVEIRGYAWSGGGRGIIRVDVSIDGGETWKEAEIFATGEQPRNRVWSWSLWKLNVPFPESSKSMDIICKAVDSSYNVQPDHFSGIYNRRGVLSNAWHRITIEHQ